MTSVLCLDLALIRTGYALLEGERVRESGTLSIPPQRPMGERLRELRGRLERLIERTGPVQVLIEESSRLQRVGGDSTATIVAMARATGIALELAATWCLAVETIDPRAVREYLAGRSGASKLELHRALALEGVAITGDPDVDDAIGLGVYWARRERFMAREQRVRH